MNATSTTTTLKNIVRGMFSLDKIRGNSLFFIAISLIIGLSIIIPLLLWAGNPDYRLLYGNMSDKDAGSITEQLVQLQIPYRFDENAGAVLVPAERVYETRLKLAHLGLPKGGNVGYELMDKEKFGISQFNEQINYQRALEGELARTIETLAPINRARVHLALSKPSLFVRDVKPPSASVTLTLFPESTLEANQVSAIAHMVSSAVPGLNVELVTLVDQSGRLLSAKNELVAQSEQLKYINDLENDYLRRIMAILVPIVGIDNVQAQVTAQLDFTEKEQTDELYQPNSSEDRKAVRSNQSSLANQSSGARVGGVPGALSNKAPLPPMALLDPLPDASESEENTGSNKLVPQQREQGRVYNHRRDETTNYELDKTLIHTKNIRGAIIRLSAAVIINYLPDSTGEKSPLTAQRLADIRALVQEAMGYSALRGDSLNIANVPFSEIKDEQQIPLWQQPSVMQFAMQLSRYLVVLIVVWLLWRKGIKPLWAKQQELALARCVADTTLLQSKAAESVNRDILKQNNEQERRARTESDIEDLRRLSEEDPQLIALVMHQWMSKEQAVS